jgi:hypothetical protein
MWTQQHDRGGSVSVRSVTLLASHLQWRRFSLPSLCYVHQRTAWKGSPLPPSSWAHTDMGSSQACSWPHHCFGKVSVAFTSILQLMKILAQTGSAGNGIQFVCFWILPHHYQVGMRNREGYFTSKTLRFSVFCSCLHWTPSTTGMIVWIQSHFRHTGHLCQIDMSSRWVNVQMASLPHLLNKGLRASVASPHYRLWGAVLHLYFFLQPLK